MRTGARIEEAGVLLRDADGFILRRDLGGRYRLELRVPAADAVGTRVRISGTYIGNDLVDVIEIETSSPPRRLAASFGLGPASTPERCPRA